MNNAFRRRTFITGAVSAVIGAELELFGTRTASAATVGTFDVDDVDAAIYYSDVAHQTSFGDAWRPLSRGEAPGRQLGTAHVAKNVAGKPARWFSYTHPECSRIQWRAATGPDRGTADVYVDGQFRYTANLYSAQFTPNVVAFDTGPLPSGSHTLKVIVSGSGTVELDTLRVTGEQSGLRRVSNESIDLLDYRGGWTDVAAPTAIAGHTRVSDSWGASTEFAFTGSTIRWIGSTGPTGGIAKIAIDGVTVGSVNAYSAQTARQVNLFERTDLDPSIPHVIKITVDGAKVPLSTGCSIFHEAFDCAKAAVGALIDEMNTEIDQIRAGTKPYLSSSTWTPVPYVANAPQAGVVLATDPGGSTGALLSAFAANLSYLNYSFGLPAEYTESAGNPWLVYWPDANHGRMLRGAAHTLRWGERADMRAIVTTVVNKIKAAQSPNGWALQIPQNEFPDLAGPGERANYDRAMWARGMVAASQVSDPNAGLVLRRFGDWFNSWVTARIADPARPMTLLECNHGIQGHIASTITYFSPIGTSADLVAAERYYVQDYWIKWLRQRQAVAIWRFPLSRPHSYLITGFEALLDHYRATGAAKYLDAVRGGWEMFVKWFQFPGGGTSICEGYLFHQPGAYRINLGPNHINNEHCGSAFWITLNHRLLQLFPTEEKYANEIERSLFNGSLAHQQNSAPHRIRYTGHLQEYKDGENGQPMVIYPTCCELQGTEIYAQLPQYIYSIAADGLYINLYASSNITWQQGTTTFGVQTATRFPYEMGVSHTVTASQPTSANLRVRIPLWATGPVAVSVNGQQVAVGQPGSYLQVNRTWTSGDIITYTLTASPRLTHYTGVDTVPDFDRYAVEYGPLLYAAVGTWDSTYRTDPNAAASGENPGVPRINVDNSDLLGALVPAGAGSLDLVIQGESNLRLRPYWLVNGERFNVFPIVERRNDPGAPYHTRRGTGAWDPLSALPGVSQPNHTKARDCAIVHLADGSAHIVFAGLDGTLFHQIRYANGGWQSPQPLTGLGPAPVARCRRTALAAGADGTVHVVAVGSDKGIYYQRRDPSGGWTRFTRVSTTSTAKDVSLALAPTLTLAFVDDTGLVWTTSLAADDTWSTPVAVTGVGSAQARGSRIAVAGSTDGSMHLALISSDGLIRHKLRQAGSWSTLSTVANAQGKDLSLTCLSAGRIGLAIVGGDDYFYYQERSGTGTWSGFQALPGVNGQPYFKARSVGVSGVSDTSVQLISAAW